MKQKRQAVFLAMLALIAGIVWYFQRFQPAATASAIPQTENSKLLSVENPQLHRAQLEEARKTEYKSSGRNIFSTIAAPPPVLPKPRPTPLQYGPPKPADPPPLPPPTLSVKFFGYGTVPNSRARVAFFTNGEEVYIVAEGEVLLNRFRIIRVGNASLEFEEISTGRRGTAPLEDQNAGGPSA